MLHKSDINYVFCVTVIISILSYYMLIIKKSSDNILPGIGLGTPQWSGWVYVAWRRRLNPGKFLAHRRFRIATGFRAMLGDIFAQGSSSMTPLGMLWPAAWLLLFCPSAVAQQLRPPPMGFTPATPPPSPNPHHGKPLRQPSGAGLRLCGERGKFIATNYHVVSNKVMEPQNTALKSTWPASPRWPT